MSKGRKIAVVIVSVLALALVVAAGVWFGVRHALRRNVFRAVEKIERDSKGVLKAEIGDVSFDPLSFRMALQNVRLSIRAPQGAYAIRFLEIRVKKWRRLKSGSDVFREQALEFSGVSSPQIDALLANALPAAMAHLGKSISLDGAYSASYAPEKDDELRLDAAVSSPRLGAMSLGLVASGIDLVEVEKFAKEARAAEVSAASGPQLKSRGLEILMKTKVHEAHIAIRDRGLMKLIWALQAARAGVTTEDARRRALITIRSDCAEPKKDAWMALMCDPMLAFVEQPKSLRLSIAPSAPLAVSGLGIGLMMSGPQAVIEQLGLTLVANED
jgi:hypothetical protein